jgi:hypothetical protein
LVVAVLLGHIAPVATALILYFLLSHQLVVVAVLFMKPKVQMVVQVVEKPVETVLPLGLRVVVVLETLHLQVHHKEITVGLVEETAAVKFLLGAVVAAQVVWVVMRQVHRQTPQVVTAVLEPLHQSQAQA